MMTTCLTLVALMVPCQSIELGRKPEFTISKETTYITSPLTKRGYPDYAAAINERLSRGVTAENNANVMFWRAMGPHPESATMDPEFFRLMGMGEPPEDQHYFVDLDEYLTKFDGIDRNSDEYTKVIDQQRRVSEGPWKTKDFPAIAAWLTVNESPLRVAIEGSRRPHYYSPLFVPEKDVPGGLIAVLLPAIQKSRVFARALSARAMLHLGEGQIDAAWQDILACHRIGRLVGRGPTLVEGLVGIAIDAVATEARMVLLQNTQMSAKQSAKFLRDIDGLLPLPDLGEKTYLCERFFFLDITLAIAHAEDSRLLQLVADNDLPPQIKKIPFDLVDWDVVLKMGNAWFDSLEDAVKTENRAKRLEKMTAISDELKEFDTIFADQQGDLKKIAELVKKKDKEDKTLSKMMGNVLIKLIAPGWTAVMKAEGRAFVRNANSRTAIALAAYHHENGRYPKQLSELCPKFVKQLPNDYYSDELLVYKPTDNGYLLYSIGPNGIDEKGDESNGDDLVLRVPYKAD